MIHFHPFLQAPTKDDLEAFPSFEPALLLPSGTPVRATILHDDRVPEVPTHAEREVSFYALPIHLLLGSGIIWNHTAKRLMWASAAFVL